MTILISIDPGVQGCGVALFKDTVLQRARYVEMAKQETWSDLVRKYTGGTLRIIFEKAQVYRGRLLKGDPNDLISESIAGAELAGYLARECECWTESFTRPEAIWPAKWKKQLPKDICHARLKAVLKAANDGELSRIEGAGELTHNVWDAVGIGLWTLKRWRP